MALTTTNYSPEYLGDPHYNIMPLHTESPLNSLHFQTTPSFSIEISVVLTRPSLSDSDDEDFQFIHSDSDDQDSVELSETISLPPHSLADPAAAREAISRTLSAVHAPPSLLRSLADHILRFFLDGHVRVTAQISVFVDHLPGDHYHGLDLDLDHDKLGFGKREAIMEALKSERATAMEKSVTCSICIDEIRVGSDLTRLACSHCYHEHCIAEWFVKNNNNMSCPMCRCCFELEM